MKSRAILTIILIAMVITITGCSSGGSSKTETSTQENEVVNTYASEAPATETPTTHESVIAEESVATSEALGDYLRWRDVIFSVTSDQVGVVTDQPNQVYGVIMDVGLSDDFIISISAFPTGESSLRTTVGGGAIGLGSDETIAAQAESIVVLAQSLTGKAHQINNQNLPKSQKVYFYFLTTSGLMLSETNLEEVSAQDHPFYEMFGRFTEIKRRSEELTNP